MDATLRFEQLFPATLAEGTLRLVATRLLAPQLSATSGGVILAASPKMFVLFGGLFSLRWRGRNLFGHVFRSLNEGERLFVHYLRTRYDKLISPSLFLIVTYL